MTKSEYSLWIDSLTENQQAKLLDELMDFFKIIPLFELGRKEVMLMKLAPGSSDSTLHYTSKIITL